MTPIKIKSGTVLQIFDGSIWLYLKPLKKDRLVKSSIITNNGNSYRFKTTINGKQYIASVDASKCKTLIS